MALYTTVIWENFVAKIFSCSPLCMQNKCTKYFQQRKIIINRNITVRNKPSMQLLHWGVDWSQVAIMSIRRYLQQKNGLPDPNGSLSWCLLTQAITHANSEIAKAIGGKGEKHGNYNKWVWIQNSLSNSSIRSDLCLVRAAWPGLQYSASGAQHLVKYFRIQKLSYLDLSTKKVWHENFLTRKFPEFSCEKLPTNSKRKVRIMCNIMLFYGYIVWVVEGVKIIAWGETNCYFTASNSNHKCYWQTQVPQKSMLLYINHI